jgi:hypothetical protein
VLWCIPEKYIITPLFGELLWCSGMYVLWFRDWLWIFYPGNRFEFVFETRGLKWLLTFEGLHCFSFGGWHFFWE